MVFVCSGLMARNKSKKQGLSAVERQEKYLQSQRKPYKQSKWSVDMVNAIKRNSDDKGNFNQCTGVIEQLDKKGMFKGVPKNTKETVNNVIKEQKTCGGFGKKGE